MMWRTSNGDRTLLGAEAELLKRSIGNMVDMALDEGRGSADHWHYGVPVFDRLTWRQQLAVLVDVAEALLSDAVPPPTLTAINEAAIGAAFANIRQLVE
jgi:hypothetical protein